MQVIGITGKRAAGKSTVARMLKRLGGLVFDADAVCAHLYACDVSLLAEIATTFEEVVIEKVLEKQALSRRIRTLEDIKKLERIVHPRVEQEAVFFLQRAHRARKNWVVLDIPLLFEGGYARYCDRIITLEVADFIRRMRIKKNILPQDQQGIEPLLLENRWDFRVYRNKSDAVINTGCSFGMVQKKVQHTIWRWGLYP